MFVCRPSTGLPLHHQPDAALSTCIYSFVSTAYHRRLPLLSLVHIQSCWMLSHWHCHITYPARLQLCFNASITHPCLCLDPIHYTATHLFPAISVPAPRGLRLPRAVTASVQALPTEQSGPNHTRRASVKLSETNRSPPPISPQRYANWRWDNRFGLGLSKLHVCMQLYCPFLFGAGV